MCITCILSICLTCVLLISIFSKMDQESQQKGSGLNKHYWTTQGNKTLNETLVELSTNTMWREKKGFRNGELYWLEKMIKEKFPHTLLKAVPNIVLGETL